MSLSVSIDRDECVSAGKCVADNPRAFAFDEEELAVALPGAGELTDEALLKAARRCPSGAIRLTDDTGTPVEI